MGEKIIDDGDGNRHFAAISKSGFTKKAEEFAKKNEILLFTLEYFGCKKSNGSSFN